MTNEEKREYVRTWYRLLMKHHAAAQDDLLPDQEVIASYQDFLAEFSGALYPLQPKKFYRYRTFSECELKNLRNGTAWFSCPEQFDDSVDSTLNIDLEAELAEILGPNGDAELRKRFVVSYLEYQLKKVGIQVNRELIKEAVEKMDSLGFEKGATSFFGKYLGDEDSRQLTKQTEVVLDSICNDELKEAVLGWIQNYQDTNKKIRASMFTLCLAEEGDNDVMWGRYAGACEGFCIQYEIPPTTAHAQLVLSNMLPIYYGEKPAIRLGDILKDGVFNPNGETVIHGIRQSDYENMYVSIYTKSPGWSFQKEWRVTYGKENLQPFPYATALILGEKMPEDHKEKLIEIAKEKGLSVFERRLNSSGSKVICEKLF